MGIRILATVGVLVVAACSAQNPSDGDQYFDNINPNPATLQNRQSNSNSVVIPATVPAAGAADDASAEPTLSTSQDFRVVKEKETIESDAAKLAALKEQYTVVQPSEVTVPQRNSGVNLATYAVSQKNPVGARVYRRFNVGLGNCAKYRNDPDGAQRAFLEAGGPEKDRLRLDGDGDGYACGWNPETYRRLVQQGS